MGKEGTKESEWTSGKERMKSRPRGKLNASKAEESGHVTCALFCTGNKMHAADPAHTDTQHIHG